MRPILYPRLRGGAWNLRQGRKPATVAREVHQLLRDHKLHFLAVCEAAGYLPALRSYLRKRGYVVACFPDADQPGRDSAVIVRADTYRGGKLLHRMGTGKWERDPKNRHLGLHLGRAHVSCLVAWLRVMAMHAPPTPDYRRAFPRRAKAWTRWRNRLAWIMAQWRDRPYVIPGDANVRATDPRVDDLCDRRGATVTGHGIDFTFAGPLVEVSNWRRVRFGTSDHDPQLFDVTHA